MASTGLDKKCEHPACTCPTGGGQYCSKYCEEDPAESICECGHLECQAAS